MIRATEFAEGVSYVTTLLSNLYFIDNDDGSWALLDAGLPGIAARIRAAAQQRYGADSAPKTIILSHGHFDHVGSVQELADYWDIPIFAHRLEMPYLTGRSSYPPGDPVSSSGSLGFIYRFFPTKPYNLAPRVQLLPEDGTVPGLPGWRAVHTPGHTPGHVAFFRERDRVLLAADALTTGTLDSPMKFLFSKRDFQLPPAPFTTDWVAAKNSVQKLAELDPLTVAVGHGFPLSRLDLPSRLRRFAAEFEPPKKGRYVRQPALADETGVTFIPPPVPDITPAVVGGLAVLGGIAGAVWYANRRRRSRDVERRTAA
jgi:glyoxylase-like metal-dependent hydrolase (beta-lactamase superfamily II)